MEAFKIGMHKCEKEVERATNTDNSGDIEMFFAPLKDGVRYVVWLVGFGLCNASLLETFGLLFFLP